MILLENQTLKEKLEKLFQKQVDLYLKDNRSVFLRAKKNSRKKITLILHIAFLNASEDVLIALKEYVDNNKKVSLSILKNFIEEYFQKNDYSFRLAKKSLKTKGRIYDLQEILKDLDVKYFKSSLSNINITWRRKPKYRKFSSITFASYDSALKLIRVNSILDDMFFPSYFVSFTVYHEILHHLNPIKINTNGRRQIHTKDFKYEEKKYHDYQKAKLFEKKIMKERRKTWLDIANGPI